MVCCLSVGRSVGSRPCTSLRRTPDASSSSWIRSKKEYHVFAGRMYVIVLVGSSFFRSERFFLNRTLLGI